MPIGMGDYEQFQAYMQLSPMVISVAALIRTPAQIKQYFPIWMCPSPSGCDRTCKPDLVVRGGYDIGMHHPVK